MDICIVLPSLNGSTYRQTYASPFRSLPLCRNPFCSASRRVDHLDQKR
jgi:hypothetical protein